MHVDIFLLGGLEDFLGLYSLGITSLSEVMGVSLPCLYRLGAASLFEAMGVSLPCLSFDSSYCPTFSCILVGKESCS